MNRWARVAMGLLAAFGVLAALAGGAMAQEPSPAGMMAEANQRFERGEFAEAAQQYEALVGLGIPGRRRPLQPGQRLPRER